MQEEADGSSCGILVADALGGAIKECGLAGLRSECKVVFASYGLKVQIYEPPFNARRAYLPASDAVKTKTSPE